MVQEVLSVKYVCGSISHIDRCYNLKNESNSDCVLMH